jgi:hypothetical protein
MVSRDAESSERRVQRDNAALAPLRKAAASRLTIPVDARRYESRDFRDRFEMDRSTQAVSSPVARADDLELARIGQLLEQILGPALGHMQQVTALFGGNAPGLTNVFQDAIFVGENGPTDPLPLSALLPLELIRSVREEEAEARFCLDLQLPNSFPGVPQQLADRFQGLGRTAIEAISQTNDPRFPHGEAFDGSLNNLRLFSPLQVVGRTVHNLGDAAGRAILRLFSV